MGFLLKLIASSTVPGLQLIWVFMLTSFVGLAWWQILLGLVVPFYGWFLILTRTELLFWVTP